MAIRFTKQTEPPRAEVGNVKVRVPTFMQAGKLRIEIPTYEPETPIIPGDERHATAP